MSARFLACAWYGRIARGRHPARAWRNGMLLLLLILLCFSLSQSQERAPHQLIVPLTNGGFVAFKAETAFAETKKASDQQQARAVFDSQALIDDNQVIHRLLVDTDGRPVFGYDLAVVGNADLRQFTVTARPLD